MYNDKPHPMYLRKEKFPKYSGQLQDKFVCIEDREIIDRIYNEYDRGQLGKRYFVLYVLPEGDDIVQVYGSNDVGESHMGFIKLLYKVRKGHIADKLRGVWKRIQQEEYASHVKDLQEIQHNYNEQRYFK